MRGRNNRRVRFAWLLMLVYLPMLLAITFHHHHSEAEGNAPVYYCYQCAHHIHDDGHLTGEHSLAHMCALCYLHSLPYVVPVLVQLSLFIAIFPVAFVTPCPFVKTRQGDIHSTRAPPVLLFL